jgi:hypothetical protein
MRKIIVCATASVAVMGAALAQMQASSSVYFLDVDPGRYGGPAGQRVSLQLGDQPRSIALGSQDEICVQLLREAADSSSISAHVRALRPEPQAAAIVQVAGPKVTPGTYRSTPWGMLLRVVSDQGSEAPDGAPVTQLTADAPVCTL